MTQKERVKGQLRTYGQISNFDAIHNYMLRLGDIIFRLRKEGWEIEGNFGEGKDRKNFVYKLIKEPEPEQLKVFKN